MRNIIITIAAVLTLIGCSPEDMAVDNSVDTPPSSPLIGKWLVVKKPYGVPNWDTDVYEECDGNKYITFKENMRTETVHIYKWIGGNYECKESVFNHDYRSTQSVHPGYGNIEYWRVTYNVQIIGDTMLLGRYNSTWGENMEPIWGEFDTTYELKRVN